MEAGRLRAISWKRNKRKCLETLRGILQGLVADRSLNELEVQFLDLWLADSIEIHSDPDAIDLIDAVRSLTLSTAAPTALELKDLKTLIEDILRYRDPEEFDPETFDRSLINILTGFIQGIAADRIVNPTEARALRAWLRENNQLLEAWPGSAIYKRINCILADGKITDEEQRDFLALLDQVGAANVPGTGSAQCTTCTLGAVEVEELHFADKLFCLTGNFVTGTRAFCHSLISDRGGVVKKNVMQKLDYLVLGTVPSPNWIHTSFGHKIKNAVDLQKQGRPITIITEECWSRFI